MDRSGPPANIISDKQGSAVILLGLLFFFVCFLFGSAVMEYRMLLIFRDKINDALVGAELAAVGTLDKEKMGYGVLELDPASAREVFDAYLLENLGELPASPPVVEEFVVYNPGDYPSVCPYGAIIQETAVHAVIRVEVARPLFRGLLGETVSFTVHKDSDDILD